MKTITVSLEQVEAQKQFLVCIGGVRNEEIHGNYQF